MTFPTDNEPLSELNYQATSPWGSAPFHVRVVAIFMFISAGLSVIGAVYVGTMAAFSPWILKASAAPGSPPPPPFMSWFLPILYGLLAVIALGVAVVKLISGLKLLRGGKYAWGWALAAAITGCLELMWCSLGCVLPLAASIYTIVILSQPNTRAYLAARQSPAGAEPR